MSILLGILMILGAGYMLAMPSVVTGVMVCWILSGVMIVAGIVAIIHYIEAKNAEKVAEKSGIPYMQTGIGSLILGIAAVVLGILVNTTENGEEVFMQIIAIVFGVWVVLDGISFIKRGISCKKVAAPGWLPMIIMGVLTIAAGILCIVYSFVSISVIGTFYAISMMMFGFTMILQN